MYNLGAWQHATPGVSLAENEYTSKIEIIHFFTSAIMFQLLFVKTVIYSDLAM